MDLSRLVMKLAFRRVPAGREDWAHAMQAEFDVLRKGRMAWAMGCLWASLGWDLRANALYWLALPVSIVAVEQWVSTPLFSWLVSHCPPEKALCAYDPYYAGSLEFLVPCMIFGLCRPDRIVTTAIAMALCKLVYIYLFFAFAMHNHSYVHIMNMPPVVGEIVVLTGGLIAVTTGAFLGQGGRQIVQTLRHV